MKEVGAFSYGCFAYGMYLAYSVFGTWTGGWSKKEYSAQYSYSYEYLFDWELGVKLL